MGRLRLNGAARRAHLNGVLSAVLIENWIFLAWLATSVASLIAIFLLFRSNSTVMLKEPEQGLIAGEAKTGNLEGYAAVLAENNRLKYLKVMAFARGVH